MAEYLISNDADYTILSVAGLSPIDMAPNESLVRNILARKIMELFPLAIKKKMQEKRASELSANQEVKKNDDPFFQINQHV